MLSLLPLQLEPQSYANWQSAQQKVHEEGSKGRGSNSISHCHDFSHFNERISVSLSALLAAETNSQIWLPLGDAHCGHQGWLHTGDASHTEEGSATGAVDARHSGHLRHVGADGSQVGTG